MSHPAAFHSRYADSVALQAPSRLLAGSLLASVTLHVVLVLLLPGWWKSAPPEVPAVIDVVLMPADVPMAPAAPVPLARATAIPPSVRSPKTAPVVRTPAAAPARNELAVAAAVAEATFFAVAEPVRPTVTAAPATPKMAVAPRAEPVTPPAFNAAYLRNPPPRYPPTARRSGDEGTVLLRVLVAADGAAARVELDRSSGSSLLDGAALDAVRDWRFVPARRGTQNVEDWVRVPVVFRLES